jgi:CheY-like chemotaxis protein
MPEQRQRCLDAGMDDFIAKPLMVVDLRRCLDRVAPIDAAAFDAALADALRRES